MTFTGQSGRTFQADTRSGRISMYEVLRADRGDDRRACCARATSCRRRARTRSATRSPICCSIPTVARRSRSRASCRRASSTPRSPTGCTSSRASASRQSLREAIDRLWARGDDDPEAAARACGCCASCSTRWSAAIPRGRCARARSAVKAVYVHSHMDEETFDTERAVDCCDSNCYADGTTDPGLQLQRAVPREGGAVQRRARAVGRRASGGQRTFILPVLR